MNTGNPEDHDYDWVSATEECSVAAEFARLQDNARTCVVSKNERIVDPAEKFTLEVESGHRFLVKSSTGHFVSFTSHADHIEVQCADLWDDRGKAPYTLGRLTLTLNEQQKCRYQFNGSGLYLRWQIMEKALKTLLFVLPDKLKSNSD